MEVQVQLCSGAGDCAVAGAGAVQVHMCWCKGVKVQRERYRGAERLCRGGAEVQVQICRYRGGADNIGVEVQRCRCRYGVLLRC